MNEIITKLLASTAALALAAFSPSAFAQSPQGATVASGSITVTRQGATTVVTQGTNKGIIDWRSFSIGAQEAVRFDQPGRSSVTLNRVTGSELSRIDGHLSATGQVWLSNPNGVLIGPGGQVNVGGLLATTGRIDAAELLRSGRALIDQIGKDAAIVNSGAINITEGGYAALAAASIRNEGVIAARAGSVALGSGKAMTVDFIGDKLITFQVTEALDQAPAGDTMISNGGTVTAAGGGTVLMSARAAKGVMDNVINLKGHVVANSVKVDGGTVSFGDGGIVLVSGKIDASNATGKGGAVAVLGEKVGLTDGASIDASGATGGGSVLVGGDWQGKGAVQNALVAYVAPTASINVDATMAGDGGKAVVWADDATRFNGTISARGGMMAGNGGQVETSGKKTLGVGDGAVVTTATRASGGKAGSWLLDPYDVTINTGASPTPAQFQAGYDPGANTNISASSIVTALALGDVTIQTSNTATGGSGDITIAGAISYSGAAHNTFTLDAFNDIIVNAGFSSTATGTNVLFKAGRDIQVLAPVSTNGGSFTAISNSTGSGAGAIKVAGAITTGGGNVILAGGTSLTGSTPAVGGTGGGLLKGVEIYSGLLDAGGGDITINGKGYQGNAGVDVLSTVQTSSSGTISIKGSTPTGTGGAVGVNISSAGVVTTNGVGLITITGDSSNTGASSHGVNIAGSVTQSATGGAISITGTRGLGASSSNIALASSAVLSTDSGSLSLIGNNQGGSTTASFDFGIDLQGTLSTVSGAIKVDGAGTDPATTTGTNNYGITLYNSTRISATGTGSILLKGLGSGSGTYHGIWNVSALASGAINTVSGDLVLQANLAKLDNSTSAADAFKSTTGTVKLKSLTLTDSIGLGANTGDSYFGGFVTGVIDANTKLEIGDPGQTGAIQVATGWTFNNDTTFVTGSGGITFAGAIDGAKNVTARTNASGVVSFAGDIGATAALASFTRADSSAGTTAKTVFGSGATQLKTSGNQSFSGPVELTAASVLFDSSAGGVTFNGPVDSAVSLSHSNLVVNAATSGVVFNNNFGLKTGYALASFTSGSGTTATFKGSNYVTDGSQAYGGAILLGNDATIAAGGAVTFGSTIDTAASTAAKAFTVNAASVAFNTLAGAIGGGTALSSLSLSVTNNDIVLPALTVLNDLTVSTSGAGAITQVGGMSVGNLAMFTASTGDVTLFNALNNFNKFSVTTTSGAVAVWDSAGSIDITGANIGSGGSLIIGNSAAAPGTIIQSGAITTPSLSFSNADKIILNNAANKVGALIGNFNNTATNQSLLFSNGSAGGLTLGNLIGKSLDITQSGGGAVTVAGLVSGTNQVNLHQTGGGALNVNGTIATTGKADVYASGGALSFGGGSLLSAGTASFGGASVNGSSTTISVTNAPLVLYASSGSITGSTISVNANATNPVASGFVTLATTGGTITLNSETVNGPPAPVVVVTPTTATTATVASLATVANVASVATTATVASVASIATAPTFPTGASVASIPTISFVQNVINIITNAEPGGVTTIINQVLPPTPNFSLVLTTPLAGGDSGQRSGAVNSSARALANLVTLTPAGAFIPPSAPFVAGTGAPLAVTPTIKVDAADTGGANGQVIAVGQAGVGFGAGGGGRAVLPGLLSEFRNPAAAPGNQEPPPSQLPATMNEEPLLD